RPRRRRCGNKKRAALRHLARHELGREAVARSLSAAPNAPTPERRSGGFWLYRPVGRIPDVPPSRDRSPTRERVLRAAERLWSERGARGAFFRHLFSPLQQILDDGVRSGELRQLDTAFATQALFNLVDPWTSRDPLPGGRDAQQVAADVVGVVVDGIGV